MFAKGDTFVSSFVVVASTTWLIFLCQTQLPFSTVAEELSFQALIDSTAIQTTPLCSQHNPFPPGAIEQAVQQNDAFHKQGGALHSVLAFRTSAIDKTLEKLDLEFVPNAEPKDGKVAQQRPSSLQSYLKEYYSQHYDSRGGYGKPLPGLFATKGQEPVSKRKNDALPALMGDRWVDPIEEYVGRDKWDAALGPIGPQCENLVRLGDAKGDGYKFFCTTASKHGVAAAAAVVESSKVEAKGPGGCHILSVGGNDNWKFEVAAADTLNCTTHTFDCTLPNNTPKRKPNRDDLKFYPHCLDGKAYKDDHGRSYITYQDMLQLAGIQTSPAVFEDRRGRFRIRHIFTNDSTITRTLTAADSSRIALGHTYDWS